MERIKLGKDLEISRVAHGFWRLLDWGSSNSEVLELIEKDIENGITTFDNADIYGEYMVEEKFGEIISKSPKIREKIEIVTKCGIKLISENRPEHKIKHYDTSSKHIINSVENSLKNLRTDYIDLLLIHRPDPLMNPNEIASAFSKLKQSGKVKEFGVSNFLPHQFEMLESYLDVKLVTNQVEISVLELQQFDNGVIEHCLKNRISPMAWSPLAGGQVFSSGVSKRTDRVRTALFKVAKEHNTDAIDAIMYAWILNHPAKVIPVFGSGNWKRIDTVIEALKIKLTREQWFEIYEASRGEPVA